MPRRHVADAIQKKLVIHFPELRLAVYKDADLPFFLVCLAKLELCIHIIQCTENIVKNVQCIRRHFFATRRFINLLL